MLATILIASAIVLLLAYRFYGGFLTRHCGIDDSRETPAITEQDGVDFVPTATPMLFGHHFSSIAGAGPIVGPILATMYFGWGPTLAWILLGAIFVGGIHDFGSTLMSLRNKGRTITEITHKLVGARTGLYFRLFLLFALIYVIIVFLDLTATTFSATPAVATASGWFVLMAVGCGLMLRVKGLHMWLTLALFIPLTFAGLALGHFFPADGVAKNTWLVIIIGYCLVAAVLPVNVLLQPRDFLSSLFLYVMMALGVVGLIIAGTPIKAPAFEGFITDKANPGFLFPVLFITVACGACSGFHSLVASGTTSKQIARESDAKRIGYGAMLVEGLLAVFALATVSIMSAHDLGTSPNPVVIFSQGAAVFMEALGIPARFGAEFTALAVSTFLLTTLDTCTRLARFLVEETFSWRNQLSRYLGTAIVLIIPALFVFQSFDGQPAWKVIWPLFGATNQLMAALALVTFVVYLKAEKLDFRFAIVPAAFMLVAPLAGLVFMVLDTELGGLIQGISLGMLLLGLYVSGRSIHFILERHAAPATA